MLHGRHTVLEDFPYLLAEGLHLVLEKVKANLICQQNLVL